MKEHKGFFFTLIIFLLIGYLLLSSTLWVKSVEVSEKKFSNEFRIANIENVVSQIKEDQINKIADIIVRNALFRINECSISNPLRTGPPENEFANLNLALDELVRTGNARGVYFTTNTRCTSSEGGFEAWRNHLSSSLQKVGLRIPDNGFSLTRFNILQDAPNSTKYSFNLNIEIEDKDKSLKIVKNYQIANRELDISGFTDSAVSRIARARSPTLSSFSKQYFFHNPAYSTPSNLIPRSIPGVISSTGQGWFYGALVSFDTARSILPISLRSQYIVVGTYSDITRLTDAEINDFGAFIITSPPGSRPSTGCPARTDETETYNPVTYSSSCDTPVTGAPRLSKPFALINNFRIESSPDCPDPRDPENPSIRAKCLLFVAQHSPTEVSSNPTRKLHPVSVYNMENIRDFALCGYYTGNRNTIGAPSFLQRMLVDSYSRMSEYGIETFLIGSYIGGGGGASPFADRLSRLDRDVVGAVNGDRISGMPGCKDAVTCNNPSSLVGHFRLSDNAITRYYGPSSKIPCNAPNRASC